MTYLFAWLAYFLMALGLIGLYYRYFESLFPHSLGLVLRVLLIVILFSPWFVEGELSYLPVPACIAVIFHLLSHAPIEALKAMLPILFCGSVAMGIVLLVYKPEAAEPAPVPSRQDPQV